MEDRQNRVVEDQAGTGVTHHPSDAVPHGGLITVDRAIGAGRLAGAEGTAIETAVRVIEKFLALRAKPDRSMMPPAINLEHRLNRLLLSEKSA
jgi:hypothetical protein